MSMFDEEDPFDLAIQAYEMDPSATMAVVADAAAQRAAAEVAGAMAAQVASRVQMYEDSQQEIVALEADRALDAKYGAAWKQNRERVGEYIQARPYMIPDGMNASAIADAYDTAMKAVLTEIRDVDPVVRDREDWERIKDAGTKPYWSR